MTVVLSHGEAAMVVGLLWLVMESATMRADNAKVLAGPHEVNMARADQHMLAAALLTLRMGDTSLSDEQRARLDVARTVHEDQLRAYGESQS